MAVISKDLGPVTAYAAAVNRGYTGTREEFETLMASYATVAEEAAQSAAQAADSESTAITKAQEASRSADDAASSAANADSSKNAAAASASAAASSASSAASSESNAASSAASASQSASAASATAGNFANVAQQAISEVNSAGANQKELAKRQAEKSEAWAVGKINGEDVGQSDPAYNNNAKYWAHYSLTNAGYITISGDDETLTITMHNIDTISFRGNSNGELEVVFNG